MFIGLEPMPFQREGVEFLVSRKRALLADDVGLGKTFQSISAVNEFRGPGFILCPAHLKLQWRAALENHLADFPGYVIAGHGPERRRISEDEVFIVNYERLYGKTSVGRVALLSRKWAWGIVDEAHRAKTTRSYAFRTLVKLAPLTERLYFLTASPLMNAPIELWSLLHLMDPARFLNRHAFGVKFCGAHHGQWGWDYSGASNLGELSRLIKPYMLRRTKEQVLDQMPALSVEVIPVEGRIPDSEQVYRAEHPDWREAVKRLDVGEGDLFEHASVLRHDVGTTKIPEAVAHIKGLLESMEKVVVFAHHHDVVNGLMGAFDGLAVRYTGRDNEKEKRAALEAFTKGEARVFVGSTTAAGTGLDGLQHVCSHMVFVEVDWVPMMMFQAMGRVHRMGQREPVTVQILVLDESLDSLIAKTVVRKLRIIEKTLGGSYGI